MYLYVYIYMEVFSASSLTASDGVTVIMSVPSVVAAALAEGAHR